MSSTTDVARELLGTVADAIRQMKPLFPTYIHLLLSAVFPIYTAAHASLARPTSAAPPAKRKRVAVGQLQDEEISPTIETLTPSDALLFPLLAGVTLASLYVILKWLQDPALLNYYLGLYFAIVGLFFNLRFIKDIFATVRSVILPRQYSYRGRLWKLSPDERHFTASGESNDTTIRTSPLPGIFSVLFPHRNFSVIWSLRRLLYTKLHLKFRVKKLVSVASIVDTLDLAALGCAIPLVYYHTFIDKPWFLTNLLGFAFCYGSLQITTPGTSWTGTLLLAALFFYDIYFVFFTPMMVTVATKLDVPIKLLFPRSDGCVLPLGAEEGSPEMEEYLTCLAKKKTMAMLGLGDIVIPGMMLAFALRFDLYLYYHKLAASKRTKTGVRKKKHGKVAYLPATGSWGERLWTSSKLFSPELQAKRFPKTYFYTSVVGYVLGMIVTVVVMQVSNHAQPALLYLVPGVLLSLWGCALVKGDFKALWKYSEVPDEQGTRQDDGEGKDKDEDKKDRDTNGDNEDKHREVEAEVINQEDKKNKTIKPASSTEDDAATSEHNGSPPWSSDNSSSKSLASSPSKDEEDVNNLITFSLSVIPVEDVATTHTPETDKKRPLKVESASPDLSTDSAGLGLVDGTGMHADTHSDPHSDPHSDDSWDSDGHDGHDDDRSDEAS